MAYNQGVAVVDNIDDAGSRYWLLVGLPKNEAAD